MNDREYPANPRVGVGVIVWRGDEVLLIRRGQPPGARQWSLPGGAQHLGETVAEAGRREVMEETGVSIAIDSLVDVVDFIDRDAVGAIRYHYTLVDLSADWVAGEARAGGDAAEATWVAASRLDEIGLWQETLRVIRLSAERRRHRAADGGRAGITDAETRSRGGL